MESRNHAVKAESSGVKFQINRARATLSTLPEGLAGLLASLLGVGIVGHVSEVSTHLGGASKQGYPQRDAEPAD
jgi:hypothetical protein